MEYVYSYLPRLTFVFPNGVKVESHVIKSIVKHFGFTINFFPIYECECLVPLQFTTLFRVNQNSVYAILEIKKERRSGTAIESSEVILNHIFVPFFTPDSFNEFINTDIEKQRGNSTNEASMLTADLKMALYSATGLAANKKLLNFVAEDCDVGTMMKFLVDQTDIEKVLIDKPDNETAYSNLIITPHNINLALKELQVRYGIYNNGMTCFYDPPILYIMNRYSLTHDHEDKKPNKILIKSLVKNPANNIGVSKVTEKKDGTIEYFSTAMPSPVNQDVSLSEIFGNEVIFSNITLTTNMVSMKEGKFDNAIYPTQAIRSDSVRHDMTGVKSIVDYDEINNPYNINAVVKSANLSTLISIARINGVDVETIAPNTSVILSIEDDKIRAQEYNGNYSIIAGELVYEKSRVDDQTMLCAARNIVLSRMDS